MNSERRLSQRGSTVNQNLEEASKERGVPYVPGNYSFQSYSESRGFLATSSDASIASTFLQKPQRFRKQAKKKTKGCSYF